MCFDSKIAVENNTVCRARGADALEQYRSIWARIFFILWVD